MIIGLVMYITIAQRNMAAMKLFVMPIFRGVNERMSAKVKAPHRPLRAPFDISYAIVSPPAAPAMKIVAPTLMGSAANPPPRRGPSMSEIKSVMDIRRPPSMKSISIL